MFFHKRLTKNKGLEVQLSNFGKSGNLFSFVIDWTRRQDHAGLMFKIEVVGLFFSFVLHDYRHWDRKLNRWEEKESDMLYG